MASSYSIILKTILLSCCFFNLVSSDDNSRGSLYDRFGFSRSFRCSQSENASISFQNNVNLLYSDFERQSSLDRYYNTSFGDNTDRVYGYYMCLADFSLEFCNSCIVNGTQFAKDTDCDQAEGVYLSHICIFGYANYSMYGMWESTISMSSYIEANVSNFQLFNQTLSMILEDLINEAAFETQNIDSILGFATREGAVTRNETIYSLAQCTPDIVGTNCSRCLQSGLSSIRESASRAPAAYVIENKCYLRYDNVSFYNLGEPNGNTGVGLRSANHLPVYFVVFLFLYNFYVLL